MNETGTHDNDLGSYSVSLCVYVGMAFSRWSDYDFMVVICRKKWEFMFFGMITN